jgi:hypothetical protein
MGRKASPHEQAIEKENTETHVASTPCECSLSSCIYLNRKSRIKIVVYLLCYCNTEGPSC